MTDPAAIVSAAAALLAAALAGTTLYANGRREERKWRRDVTLEALVTFLEGSFSGAGDKVFAVKKEGGNLEPHLATAAKAERRQRDALTRLRLLAPTPVIDAAKELRQVDLDVRTWALDPKTTDQDPSWAALRSKQLAGRDHLETVARTSIDLPAS
jgi:hypothetical protein